MRGVRAKFLRTFELDDTFFRKCRFFKEFSNLKLKLLILGKVPFINPFDHFLTSRKHNCNANFDKNEKLIICSTSVQLMFFFPQKYNLVIFSRFPVLIKIANCNINKIFESLGHFTNIETIYKF